MTDDTASPLTGYAAASTSATNMPQGGHRPRQLNYWMPEPRIFGRGPAIPNDGYLCSDHVLGRRGTGAALEASPEPARLRNDENDQHYEGFQAMDTSAADTSADSARKRRHSQLGLTAAKKKKAAEQPTGSRLDASGDCSTTIGDGFPTATGIGQCVTAVNSDCDPPNSCAGWTVVASRREKKRQKTGSPSQRDTLTAGEPSKSLSASNAKLKEECRREQKAQRFDFPEPGASGTRHEQNGVPSRDRSRAEPEDVKRADVNSGRPKGARTPRPAPQVQAHLSLTNKSDVNRATMTQRSGAPNRVAAATLKEPGKMPSGGGCSEQCKKETRELKATVKKMEKAMKEFQTAWVAMQLTIKQQRGVIDQQRDAIRRLQEGGIKERSQQQDGDRRR
ncbi:hypothetical protein MRX96_002287 [Rhipicephalus microplus]